MQVLGDFFRKNHPHSRFVAGLCNSKTGLGFSVNPQNRKLLHIKVSQRYPEISSEKPEIERRDARRQCPDTSLIPLQNQTGQTGLDWSKRSDCEMQ